MKRIIVTFMLVLVIFTGCGKSTINENTKASSMGEYFGTVLTITLYGADERQLNQIIEGAFQECAGMEKIFSAKLPDSELSVVNREAFREETVVSEELGRVISQALFYNELTEGSLDVSIGKLISLWGIGTESQRIPDTAEINAYAGMDGCQYILWNSEKSTIQYKNENVQLDLGAIAKGYAANQIKQYILSRNSDVYGIIDFGGNIVTIGCKQDGSAWNIGITDPQNPSRVYASVSVKDMCIVTSGNYERYFEQDGVRYHHILDPDTGYPAKNGIISSTIIGADSMQCDALSTACFILGVPKALNLIEGIEGVEAVFIDDDGKFHCTAGMSQYNFTKR